MSSLTALVPYLWLLPLGILLGAFGTLIGAGGGFLLVPILILIYPTEAPETITSISLAVVFFNALSGSVAYGRMRRIDYRSGIRFAAASIPGAAAGAFATTLLARHVFDAIFGCALLCAALSILFTSPPTPSAPLHIGRHRTTRSLQEASGVRHHYTFDTALGLLVSVFVGFLSSLLGIGGGIIHVPALTYALSFPPHIATATSHFVLIFVALAGTLVHVATGAFHHGLRRTAVLGIGVVLGAQLGARASGVVQGRWILRGLAVALVLVAVRVLLQAV